MLSRSNEENIWTRREQMKSFWSDRFLKKGCLFARGEEMDAEDFIIEYNRERGCLDVW